MIGDHRVGGSRPRELKLLTTNWLVCLAAALVVASGCGDTDPTPPAAAPAASVPAESPAPGLPTPSTEPGQTYAVFVTGVPGPGWVIGTAARADDPATRDLLDEVEGIAWSAEYENLRDPSGRPPYLKVSGIARPLAEIGVSDSALENSGPIAGRPARWGTDPADPEGSTFVMIALTPQDTVLLEAFDLTVDELRRFASELRPATAEEWRRAHRVAR